MKLNGKNISAVYETVGRMLDQYPPNSPEFEALDLLTSLLTYILDRKLQTDYKEFCDQTYLPLTDEQIAHLKEMGLDYE